MTKCSRCKQDKEATEFHAKKDGLQVWCKDCIQEYQRTYQQLNWASEIVKSSRNGDKRDNRPRDGDYIDSKWVRELVQNNPNCHYCETPLQFGVDVNRSTHPAGLQIDRKDSSLSHTKDNCVQCCSECNDRCQTMPYKWKVFSGGGQFIYLEMKWCPSKQHDGGDGRNHVRYLSEFGPNKSKVDGLAAQCKSCCSLSKKTRQAKKARHA